MTWQGKCLGQISSNTVFNKWELWESQEASKSFPTSIPRGLTRPLENSWLWSCLVVQGTLFLRVTLTFKFLYPAWVGHLARTMALQARPWAENQKWCQQLGFLKGIMSPYHCFTPLIYAWHTDAGILQIQQEGMGEDRRKEKNARRLGSLR